MRTGAIFARGSCRALKWLALFGVVFALGAAQAAAQITITVDDEVGEGDRVTVTVGGTISVPANTTADTTVTISGAATSRTGSGTVTDGDTEDLGTWSNLVLTLPVTGADGAIPEHPVTGTLYWQVGVDLDAEDEAVTLTFTSTDTTNAPIAAASATASVTIEDAQMQRFVWGSVPTDLKEGGMATLTLTADPTPVQLTYATDLVVQGGTNYSVSPSDFVFDASEDTAGEDGPVATITITAPGNDENRVDDTITLRALEDGTVADLTEPLSIEVEDLHKLPEVTAKLTNEDGDEIMSAAEGDEVTLTFSVAAAATEAIKITLEEADGSTAKMTAGDYTLSAMEATIASGATTSDAITVTVEKDGDIVPTGMDPEMIVLDGMVTGAAANGTTAGDPVTVTLAVMDGTMLNVTPKTEAEVQAVVDAEIAAKDGADDVYTADDDDLNFMADQFFNLPDMGFDVAITTMSSPAGVVYTGTGSEQDLWVGANMYNDPGTATVTVTVVVSSTATATTRQNSANSASVTFDVTVHEVPAPAVTGKSAADVMAAYMAARTAAAGSDEMWDENDGAATIMLDKLFNDLPATYSADATSSNTSVVLAAVSGSTLVLTPEGPGSANVTVTVGDVSVMFMVTVDAVTVPGLDKRGRITSLTIAGATEKTIDNVKRMHLTEGEITTATVEVTWNNQQLTELWKGHTAPTNPPPPALVYVYDGSWTEAASYRWLSPAEVSENPGGGSRGGNDLVFGSRSIEVEIPPAPKTDKDSIYVTDTAKGSTSLSLPHDDDAEAEGFRIYWFPVDSRGVKYEGSLTNNLLTEKTHVIEDDDPQGIKLTRHTKGTIYEGGSDVDFRVVADPEREDLPLDVRFDLTDTSGVSVSSLTYTLDTSIGQIPPDGGTSDYAEVTLNLAPNDGDREDDMLQMHAEVVSYALNTGAYGDVGSKMVEFTVLDRHKLPPLSVMPETATLMEGGKIELTLTVDRNPAETRAVDPEKVQYTAEPLSITVKPSGTDASDYSLSSTAITVEKHNGKAPWMQEAAMKLTVEATSDENVEADAMLMLDFTVNGTVAANGGSDTESDAQAVLTITDATATMVSVRDNAYDVIQGVLGTPPSLMTSMSGELMGANLFDYDANAVDVVYATSVDGGAVTASVSGGTITIMGVMAGEAKVSITATATPKASSLIIEQTKSNVAKLTFPVMVEDAPLTFMVMGPDEMNLTEGGMGGMVKVMTNRAVSENTEVMLMRDGSSSASDDDYMLDPPLVTIMAGMDEGHTMVTAKEDSMAEDMEMLTLFLVVDGMQMTDQSVSFYLWDAAVPALPIIAQLLLAAFLAIGGYRRYLRR